MTNDDAAPGIRLTLSGYGVNMKRLRELHRSVMNIAGMLAPLMPFHRTILEQVASPPHPELFDMSAADIDMLRFYLATNFVTEHGLLVGAPDMKPQSTLVVSQRVAAAPVKPINCAILEAVPEHLLSLDALKAVLPAKIATEIKSVRFGDYPMLRANSKANSYFFLLLLLLLFHM